MKKVWILKAFDRNDEYCSYEIEICGVYEEDQYKQALSDFYKECINRIDEDDEVEIGNDVTGILCDIHTEDCEDFAQSIVSLELKELQEKRKVNFTMTIAQIERKMLMKSYGLNSAEDFALENDENYGCCETCIKYKSEGNCPTCKECSEYVFDEDGYDIIGEIERLND